MTTAALVIGGIVAVLCVLFVARPFLREPAAAPEADVLAEPGPAGERRLALAEERNADITTMPLPPSGDSYRVEH